MNNKKILISVVFILVLIFIGFSIYKYHNNNKLYNTSSQDLITPNPNPAPNTPPERIAAGYVAGNVTIGPNCAGPERIDQPCKTPPQAYSSRSVIVYENDGVTVREKGALDARGNYKIAIAPGNYFIQISPAGIREGEKKPVTVKSLETSVANFDIDTGIR